MKASLQKLLDAMTLEEMLALHHRLQDLLGQRLRRRKDEIDRQLAALNLRSEKPGRASIKTKAKGAASRNARAA